MVDKNGTMKRFFQLLFLCAALAAGPANAEFLKQGALTWLTEHMAIVKSLNPSGFFVVYSEASTSPQTFDLKTLPFERVKSFFVVFDRKKNTFSKLVNPVGDDIPIAGSFTLKFSDHDSIAIDNNPQSPYVSFASGENILAFLGVNPIFNLKGSAYVAKFAANMLQSSEFKDQLKPYSVNKSNQIVLDGDSAVTRVGVTVEAENVCLKPNTVVVTADQLAALLEAPEDKQGEMLKRLRKDPSVKTIDAYMPLTYSKRSLIGFEPAESRFFDLGSVSKFPGVCVAQPIEVAMQ